MNMQSTHSTRVSLVERAAAAYGLGDLAGASRLSPATPSRGDGAIGRRGEVAVDELRESGFVLPDDPVTALAEEFRIVKRQLLLAAGGRGDGAIANGRRIMVASAQPDEGKTFCAVNLALSMAAERDAEVVLVDADFAKPEILSTLGLTGGDGLMDAIADPRIDVARCLIRTNVPNLSVLPAGKQCNNATELLASERTRMVLETLAGKDDQRIVIFDTPPALAASPASELALHVGQVLLVVRADRTTEAELREALAMLSGCGHVRLLLNGARFAPSGRRFGAYYGYGD